ncbi:MAG: hypothetical protein ACI392_09010 [Paludibacteraceae bacterium]
MNKKLLVSIICLMSYVSVNAFTHRLDSIISQKDEQWSKNMFSYNDDFSVAAYTTFTKIDGKWIQQQHKTFMRDADGNDTVIIVSTANNTLKHVYNYNAQQQLSSIYTYKIDGANATDSAKTIYTYNETGKIASEEQYVMINTTWTCKIKYEYTYTNGLISEQLNYSANQNAWKYSNRSLYEYDTNNNLIKETYQYYLSSTWYDSYPLSYKYSDNAQLQSVTKNLFDDFNEIWKLTDSTVYTYTTAGDVDKIQRYTYDNGWVASDNDTYTHTNVAASQCAGFDFAQQQLYHNASHHYTITKFTAPNSSDTYHYTAFAPTNLEMSNSNAPHIYAHDGRIFTTEPMRIYTLTGLDVTELNGSLQGIYIVKTSTNITKIIVK